MSKKFEKHFRYYFKSNHPVYIIGEKDDIIFSTASPLARKVGIIEIGKFFLTQTKNEQLQCISSKQNKSIKRKDLEKD